MEYPFLFLFMLYIAPWVMAEGLAGWTDATTGFRFDPAGFRSTRCAPHRTRPIS